MTDVIDSGEQVRHPAIGTLVADRYRIERVLGDGGMATVFQAVDGLLDRAVAVKIFAARVDGREALRQQEQEAKVIASLNHASLTTLFDAGVDTDADDRPRIYLVMELLGSDLKARLRRGVLGHLPVCWLGWDLAAALDAVHQAGLLHRDVKPANVLLSDRGTELRPIAKLTDFGIAALAGTAEGIGSVTGSVAYLSPEQVRGEPLTPASDTYSLGLVLLEALTGEIAFPGSIDESALARLDRAPLLPPGVPTEVASVIRGMTAIEPGARISLLDAAARFGDVLVDSMVAGRESGTGGAEPARLEAVRQYGVVGMSRDETFDRVTRLASRMMGAPISLMSVIDGDRVHHKSTHGVGDLDVAVVDRGVSFCATTYTGGREPWTIPDATADPRTAANPFVQGSVEVRSYAAAPLITADGHLLGALCVFDTRARHFEQSQLDDLRDLADLLMHDLELRLATQRALFAERS